MSERSAPAQGGVDDWNAHWDSFGEASESNPAQEFRRLLAIRLLEKGGTPTRLLDIGSGRGELLAVAARRWPGAELLGLELSEAGVQAARRAVPSARFRTCDLLTEPPVPADEAAWATHAVCSEVLEHVDDPAAMLRNVRPWLQPGAWVVITVPGGPMSAFDRHIGHRRHFTPEDLQTVMLEAELDPIQVSGAGYPFFNIYRRVIISRGEKLIEDVSGPSTGGTAEAALPVRLGMAAFRPLLRLSAANRLRGWQTIGIARAPGAP